MTPTSDGTEYAPAGVPDSGVRFPRPERFITSEGESFYHRGPMEQDMPLTEFAASLAIIGAMRFVDAIGDLARRALSDIQGYL